MAKVTIKKQVIQEKEIEFEHGLVFKDYSSVYVVVDCGFEPEKGQQFMLSVIEGQGLRWSHPTSAQKLIKDIEDNGFEYLGEITDYIELL